MINIKLILECPNCGNTKELVVKAGQLSSRAMKQLFKESDTACDICRKKGLGRIVMAVKKFDMDKKNVGSVRREEDVHAPIHIDPASVTPDQLRKNIERELHSV